MANRESLIEQAKDILRKNDMGGYTIPTHGLYPFQWNWDAAITALGWMKIDESRAWLEIEKLHEGQWDNGMIPHIIFHEEVDSYFPGADVWGTAQKPATTSISQPPVLASVVKIMLEVANDRELAKVKIDAMLDKLVAYHQWWYNERDPRKTGLVVSYHPWESGMDNSPAWDESLAAVPPVTWQYKRKDLEHVDAAERPHAAEYDRYLYLVDFYKQHNFDSEQIFQHCPYKMYDVGIISILHKATKDLLAICDEYGTEQSAIDDLASRHLLTQQAISSLWDEETQSFYNKNAITDEFVKVMTTGTMMALYGELASEAQAASLLTISRQWLSAVDYGMASTIPTSDKYEPQRYWRGPVWLHINWLIANGMQHYGFAEEAEQIKASTQALVEQTGYFEYFNCETGAGCGGDAFSWTAAIALHWCL